MPKVKVGFSRYASLKTMSHSIGVMSDDLVNSDIRVAKTLPSEHYTDPECFQNQIEAFKTTWQFLGSSDQFKSAIAPLHHLDSILNEPLIRT